MIYFITKALVQMLLSNVTEGDEIASEFSISKNSVDAFAHLVDDFAPIHSNSEFAQKKGFEGAIAHGLLTSSYISGILGNKLPGPNSIINELNLKYHLPVYVGQSIIVRLKVQRVIYAVKAVYLDIKIHEKESLSIVVSGRAICSFPEEKG